MRHLALTAVGRDRPGIVAGVVAPLTRLGCNIEDSRMAILGGHFAMVLVFGGPDDLDEPALRAELASARAELALDQVELHAVGDPEAVAAQQTATHIVTAYGADHPGIVLTIAEALASLSVNICDLQTRLVGDPALYAMFVEVTLPPGLTADALGAALGAAAEAAGVELNLRELDTEPL